MMFDICDVYVYIGVGGQLCICIFVVMMFDICDVYFWGGGD